MANVQGAKELQARLNRLAEEVPREAARALYQEGAVVMKDSMRRTPVLTGALRASHELVKPEVNGSDIKVEIHTGGPSAEYGVFVHYNQEAEHKVGEALFLQNAVYEAAPDLPRRVSARFDLNRIAKKA